MVLGLCFKTEFSCIEMATAAPVLASLPPRTSLCFNLNPCPLVSSPGSSFLFKSSSRSQIQLQPRQWGRLRPVIALSAKKPATNSAERWLFEPIGDGNCRHLGFRVPLPNAFELASNMVTVGRLPGKADMVIPIATVSAQHARLEKKDGILLVTDLDSTNGTFVDDKKLRPDAVATVSPGSCITFGDTHLAAFRVSRLENEDPLGEPEQSEVSLESATPLDNQETSS